MPAINFQVKGEGFPVILIHGFCLNHEMWNDTVHHLSSDFKVYAIDLPGFGKSALISDSMTLEDAATSIVHWIKDQGIGKAIFVGHSLGGYVALAIAERFPELIQGIALVHSTAFADSDENKVNRDKTLAFIHKYGHEKWIATFVPSLFAKENQEHCQSAIEEIQSSGFATSPKTISAYTLAMRDRKDRFEVWQGVKNECLFIGGTEDIRITSEICEEHIYARELVHGHILKGIGHMSMFEDPSQFNQILNTYLVKATL